jgi:hypothetical protein
MINDNYKNVLFHWLFKALLDATDEIIGTVFTTLQFLRNLQIGPIS